MKFPYRDIMVVSVTTIIYGGVLWAFASNEEIVYAGINPSNGEGKPVMAERIGLPTWVESGNPPAGQRRL